MKVRNYLSLSFGGTKAYVTPLSVVAFAPAEIVAGKTHNTSALHLPTRGPSGARVGLENRQQTQQGITCSRFLRDAASSQL